MTIEEKMTKEELEGMTLTRLSSDILREMTVGWQELHSLPYSVAEEIDAPRASFEPIWVPTSPKLDGVHGRADNRSPG